MAEKNRYGSGNKNMNKNHADRNQLLVKSGDLVIDLSSLHNGFQTEAKRYRQEIWDYIQYRESLVKWPLANEKIAMGTSPNHR